jgi:hypothetical protein
MTTRTLVLGASYGALLGTKLAMAGHHVTLVCRQKTADLINEAGTEVRIKLRGEETHRAFRAPDLPGRIDACTPSQARVGDYHMVALAMSEPQYGSDDIRDLLGRIAGARKPCLSIMNMPPLPYLRRIPGLDARRLERAYNCPEVWAGFEPGLVTLCSPDPQAYRVPGEGANVLHVGLPTNFKSAAFADEAHNDLLRQLDADIEAVRVDGQEVPVKLRFHESLYVPFAKWAMLMTGNYRCVTADGSRSIREAVHGDLDLSRQIYGRVNDLVIRLGADASDLVPFEKYANAALGLQKPSSAARAIDSGVSQIERVDLVVKLIADQMGLSSPLFDEVVATVDARLESNRQIAA